jgi:hypothetical protein
MLLILGSGIEFFVDEPDLAALGPQGRPGGTGPAQPRRGRIRLPNARQTQSEAIVRDAEPRFPV